MATEDMREAPEGTEVEDNSDSQTGEDENLDEEATDPSATVTDQNDDDDDALEEYYRARRAREALEEQSEEERINAKVEEALRQRKAQERESAEKDGLNKVYRDTVVNVVTGLRSKKILDEDGYETTMSDQDIQELVIKHIGNMNAKQREVIAETLSEQIVDEAVARLPADVRDQFVAAVDGKELGDWLITFAEFMAPKTKFAQKVDADKELAVKAALARGRAQGQRSPAGSPPEGVESRAPKPAMEYDFSKAYDRAKALSNGDISDSEFRTLTRKARNGEL